MPTSIKRKKLVTHIKQIVIKILSDQVTGWKMKGVFFPFFFVLCSSRIPIYSWNFTCGLFHLELQTLSGNILQDNLAASTSILTGISIFLNHLYFPIFFPLVIYSFQILKQKREMRFKHTKISQQRINILKCLGTHNFWSTGQVWFFSR